MVSYDLLLKNASIIDLTQDMSGEYDIGIRLGKIEAVKKNISEKHAKHVVDVSGYMVVPGLIDMHCHIYPKFPYPEDGLKNINPDAHMFQAGVTTCVDAGSCGIRDFEQFYESVIQTSAVRVFSFINIADGGMVDLSSEQNIEEFHTAEVAEMAKKYKDRVVGIKTAHYWVGKAEDEKHPIWKSIDEALRAGQLANMPIMVDFQPSYPERTYERLLSKLRVGDIHTHMYAQQFPVLDENGKVNEYLKNAQKKGIIFDLGHGAGSFWFRNAVPAFEQQFCPNTISTDLYLDNVAGPSLNLLHVMSKYLNMGMPIYDIIDRVTRQPAKIIGHTELGSLKEGECADIAVLNIVDGPYNFSDSGNAKLCGNKRFENMMTIRNGKIVYNPYALGLEVWEKAPKEYWEAPGVIRF